MSSDLGQDRRSASAHDHPGDLSDPPREEARETVAAGLSATLED